MLVNIMVGDWSHDGHGFTDSIVYESSLDANQLKVAYRKGTKIIGFDFSQKIACDYEDSVIPKKYLKILKAHNLIDSEDLGPYADEPEEGEDYYTDSDQFAAIYMKICKLGSPDLTFERTKMPSIEIGGYGLFL